MPAITAVNGSNPSGKGNQVAADPQFPSMSLNVEGTGLAEAQAVFLSGPNGAQAARAYQVTDTSLNFVASIPVRGIYQAAVANSDGTYSPWFSFSVI